MTASNRKVFKTVTWLAVVAVVVIGVFVARLLRTGESATPVAGADRPADTRLAVTYHVVEPERLSDAIVATGTIRANEEVLLQSEVSGKITRINFREGSSVAAGTVLVKINDADLQAQLRQAAYRTDLARDREERQRQLLERGGVSQEAYDQVLNEYNIRRAETQLIEAQIAKTEIRAPFNGVIGLRQVSEGALISQNTHIATLQNIDQVKVDFSIPERYAGRVRVGDEIRFAVQGVSGNFLGRIYAMEPRIEADTRTLQLRALTPNPNRRLLPGAFAEIELLLDQVDDALLVPAIAIISTADQRSVFVVENGAAVRKPVETGVRTSTSVQIIRGLAPGDTVVTSGVQQIRTGMPVRMIGDY